MGAVLAARFGDQAPLRQAGDGGVCGNPADPGDLRPRDRSEVRDDRDRLERSLREAALHRTLEQPPARLGRRARCAEGPASRHRFEHDPAATLVIALREEPERHLDALLVVLRRGRELFHGQRRIGDDEQRLERPRELVERIGGD